MSSLKIFNDRSWESVTLPTKPPSPSSVGRSLEGATSNSTSTPKPLSFSLLTYNVYFDQRGRQVRHPALLEILKARSPDVVFFQEVEQSLFFFLTASSHIRSNYIISDTTFMGEYGVIALLHKKCPFSIRRIYREDLGGIMGRDGLLLELMPPSNYPQNLIRLCSTHLESLNHAETRKRQLTTLSKFIVGGSRPPHFGLVAGDFNSIMKHEHDIPRQLGMTDAWMDLYPTATLAESATLGPTQFQTVRKYPPSRLDKIVYWGRGRVTKIELVGREMLGTAVDPKNGKEVRIFVSDHLGMLAHVDIKFDSRDSECLKEVSIIRDVVDLSHLGEPNVVDADDRGEESHEDEEFIKALEMSLKESAKSVIIVDEDEELNRAIELSLSESDPKNRKRPQETQIEEKERTTMESLRQKRLKQFA